MKQEEEQEQDGEMDSSYKHQNFLKRLRTSLIIVHNMEWHQGRLFIKS